MYSPKHVFHLNFDFLTSGFDFYLLNALLIFYGSKGFRSANMYMVDLEDLWKASGIFPFDLDNIFSFHWIML